MRRTSSTIPFGYRISSKDSKTLDEVPEELEVLLEIKKLVSSKVLSLREGSAWI